MYRDFFPVVRDAAGILGPYPQRVELSFFANTCIVDNPTREYIHFPSIGRYVSPYTLQAVVPLGGTQVGYWDYQGPPTAGLQPHSVAAGAQVATLRFTTDVIPTSGGTIIPAAQTTSITSILNPVTVIPNFTPLQFYFPVVENQDTWWVRAEPAANAQATATQASPGTGFRNVVTSICFSGYQAAAGALAANFCRVRDGASGAGTIKFSALMSSPGVTAGEQAKPIMLAKLNWPMSLATATTIEFDAGFVGFQQAVSMSGYVST